MTESIEQQENPAARQFTSLATAVDWIADCLEKDDVPQLLAAALGAAERVERDPCYAEYFGRACELLTERHQALDLRRLYQGRDFPGDSERFKLGGHMAELGCLHIDFVRREPGWFLWDIWLCR